MNFSGSLNPNPLGITGLFSASAGGRKDFSTLWVRFLPFCLNFLGDKLTCFEELSLSKGDSLKAVVKTYRGFPLDWDARVELKGQDLDLYTRLALSTGVLNRFLAGFNTYIVSPRRLETQFSYRGPVKEWIVPTARLTILHHMCSKSWVPR